MESLGDGITKNDTQRLIKERDPSGFNDAANSFRSLLLPENLSKISGTTNYFQLKLIIRIDTVSITMFSVIKRDENGNAAILRRSFGVI